MGEYTTRTLSQNEYERLIKTIRIGYIYKNVKHRPNDQIADILVLEANLGCRIGDIMALTTDSIILDGDIYKLNITEQKTGKKRTFIVPKPVKDFIDHSCEARGITSGRIFTIEAQAVWKQLRAATGYLGLKDISTHSMRKKMACDLYESTGHDIEAVCAFLQHSSINVTRTYIRRSDAQLEKAIEGAVSLA